MHTLHSLRSNLKEEFASSRNHFAFSDIRRLISKEASNDQFSQLCPAPRKFMVNSVITMMLKMAA